MADDEIRIQRLQLAQDFLNRIEDANGGKVGMETLVQRLHKYPEIYQAWRGYMETAVTLVGFGALPPEKMAEVVNKTIQSCFSEEALILIQAELQAVGDPARLTADERTKARERLQGLLDQLSGGPLPELLVEMPMEVAERLQKIGNVVMQPMFTKPGHKETVH